MVREVEKWSRICLKDRIVTKSLSVVPIGRPNHKIKFQWHWLITFAVILLTDTHDDLAQLWPIVVICNQSNPVFWLFRALWQTMFRALWQTKVIAVSLSMNLVRGTVFLLNCLHYTCLTRSNLNWIFFIHLVTADIVHSWHYTILRFINFFNTNNNKCLRDDTRYESRRLSKPKLH